jgi:hypothetical protein
MDVRAPAVTAEETLSDIDVAIVSIPLKALPHITHLIPGCDGHIGATDRQGSERDSRPAAPRSLIGSFR